MAVCAIVSAMAADRSLRARSCALAGVTKAQARPMPARRYNATDIVESSLVLCHQTALVRMAVCGRQPSSFPFGCMALDSSVPIPKFARPRGRPGCELRNQGTLQSNDSSAVFDLKGP